MKSKKLKKKSFNLTIEQKTATLSPQPKHVFKKNKNNNQ